MAPDPVRWQSYEVSKINIAWTAVPEAVAYQIQFTDMVSYRLLSTAKIMVTFRQKSYHVPPF